LQIAPSSLYTRHEFMVRCTPVASLELFLDLLLLL
jgi:hypothetical protein